MNREKLKWCFRKDSGLRLIEPSANLSVEYFKRADESLVTLSEIETSKDWKVVAAYYAAYNALYALFMKCGIKSEIHDCTIEAMSVFIEQSLLTAIDKQNMLDLKDLRISSQFYISTKPLTEADVEEAAKTAKMLGANFKSCSELLSNQKIEEIRRRFSQIRNL